MAPANKMAMLFILQTREKRKKKLANIFDVCIFLGFGENSVFAEKTSAIEDLVNGVSKPLDRSNKEMKALLRKFTLKRGIFKAICQNPVEF